jgi:leucyl aminopeptidase
LKQKSRSNIRSEDSLYKGWVMDGPRLSVVFFDLGGTLGTPILALHSNRLTGFGLYHNVLDALVKMRANGWILGVICNTPDHETEDSMRRVLECAGIYSYFDPKLLVYSSVAGHRKDSPEIFKIAVVSAGLSASPEKCLFVGVDAVERVFAAEAGMRSMEPDSFWRILG